MKNQIPAYTDVELALRYPGLNPECARDYEYCDKLAAGAKSVKAMEVYIYLRTHEAEVHLVDGTIRATAPKRKFTVDQARAGAVLMMERAREAHRLGVLDWWAVDRFAQFDGWSWDI
jgi:hypothetical protein